jgi:hypothetical protein
MSVVYIAAPYAANEGLSIEENVQRAVAMAEMASAEGYAPILVHREVRAGLYGRDEVAEERERGMIATRAIAQMVGYTQGELWLLQLPSGKISLGCANEHTSFLLGVMHAALHLGVVKRARIVEFRWESGKPVRTTDEKVE